MFFEVLMILVIVLNRSHEMLGRVSSVARGGGGGEGLQPFTIGMPTIWCKLE